MYSEQILTKGSEMRYLISICICLLLVAPCMAETINVDANGSVDFNNIQAAINAAFDGDTVLVADGTYTGDGNRDIDFLGKAIMVRSENWPENCVIDCEGTSSDQHRVLRDLRGNQKPLCDLCALCGKTTSV